MTKGQKEEARAKGEEIVSESSSGNREQAALESTKSATGSGPTPQQDVFKLIEKGDAQGLQQLLLG